MKLAYFDCFSGISGDMVLGALVDLGVPVDWLRDELRKLPVEGYSIRAGSEKRGALRGTRVRIDIGEQPYRDFAGISAMIRDSALSLWAREKSLAVFRCLAEAEARVHDVAVENVHFHEVGALDSIIDVVGSVVGMERLGIEKVYASALPTGGGLVDTAHGILPVPAPATVHLMAGMPVYDNGIERELVTPTGAAILAALGESFGSAPEMTLISSGYGVGSHPASSPPNVLRVLLGETRSPLRSSDLLLLEAGIDDMNPEIYGYVMEQLLAIGVLDVHFIPMQMKKNRPAVLLRVLSPISLQASALDLIFRETTTLGVRIQEVKRVELPRETRAISTPYGPCAVKAVTLPDGRERLVPEYEECRRMARESGRPLLEVYEQVRLLSEQR